MLDMTPALVGEGGGGTIGVCRASGVELGHHHRGTWGGVSDPVVHEYLSYIKLL